MGTGRGKQVYTGRPYFYPHICEQKYFLRYDRGYMVFSESDIIFSVKIRAEIFFS